MTDLSSAALDILAELVAFPTVTSDSNLELIEFCERYLSGLAGEMAMSFDATGQKANLFATIGPARDGGVVLSGHTDVVPVTAEDWTTPPFVADVRDGRVFGRGTADMKGFIACALALAPRYAEMTLAKPIHFALTFDEEAGCHGARLLLDELARTGQRPAAAIVGEPTSLRVITAHKGCYEYTTTVTGLEGHGSAPAKGVNAVEYASRLIGGLSQIHHQLAERAPTTSPFDPPQTTISVGRIAGGTARNILAGDCSFDWEMRPVTAADARFAKEEFGRLVEQLRADMARVHPHATIETIIEGEVDGLEPELGAPAVDLMTHLLDDVRLDVASYGTEAGLYGNAGISAVVCGPGSIDVAHQPDEHIDLGEIEGCLAMLRRLGDHLAY